ncbi:hypothetical protein DFO54_107108 [Erwinia sp. AG740]|uniref:hypothetical protein n=1 Tax=Dickeya zeae TaxID=204042 RepID=UPI0009B732C7|nr:hypothetical protein [Dickeya zeae]PXW45072.1 hypothetical protein DFO54_107108 [Erwinia sp. AG740]
MSVLDDDGGKMTIVFIPALISLLMMREDEAGRPLTREEVETIRDNATAINLPEDIAISMAAERGYHDISPEHVWDEWISFKINRIEL